MNFSSDETVQRLLSGCPVLDDLDVFRCYKDKVKTFRIVVPSLLKLLVNMTYAHRAPKDDHGFAINALSFKYLKIVDYLSGFFSLVNISELFKVEIHLRHGDPKKLVGCLTSAK